MSPQPLSRFHLRRPTLFELAFFAVAASVITWSLIDRGPGGTAIDAGIYLLATLFLAMLVVALGSMLAMLLFVPAFLIAWAREGCFVAAGKKARAFSWATFRRTLACASQI